MVDAGQARVRTAEIVIPLAFRGVKRFTHVSQNQMQTNIMNMNVKARAQCDGCPIRYRAVCSKCDDNELLLLEDIKTYRSYRAGETILWRGEDMSFVASVVHGVASLSKTLEDGRTQMVGLLLPSDFIGRPGRSEVEFDVVATTDVQLCCFQRKPFEALIESTPHVAHRLMELAMDELDVARDWMILLGRKTAREKIATFIEMLVRRSEPPANGAPGRGLALPMTRDQIANYLGLTLETVSRQMNGLKKEGVLAFSDRHHIDVLDPAALRRATGDDREI